MYDCYLSVEGQKISISAETTIGRLLTSKISINDNSISKQHALISVYSDKPAILTDLGSVNGTYLNGNRLEPQKHYPLNHKDNIQFDQKLYVFLLSKPPQTNRGKINLKEYLFDLEQQPKNVKAASETVSSKNKTNQNFYKIPKQSGLKINDSKKIKIPQITDFLQLEDSVMSEKNSIIEGFKAKQFVRIGKKQQSRIQLQNFNRSLQEDQLKYIEQQQKQRKNLYLSIQAQKRRKNQQEQRRQQQKIKIQIQKYKNQQQLQLKRAQTQLKLKKQQQNLKIQQQKLLIQKQRQKQQFQQNLLLKQQQRRQKQIMLQDQMKKKQKQIIQKLQRQKQNQIQKLKQQESQLRYKNQILIQQQIQKKKKQLQIQAQALASQYQSIYKQTIKKMKNDISRQENQFRQLQTQIQNQQNQQKQLRQKLDKLEEAISASTKQYQYVLGQNKAYLLYASQLQNKLDKIQKQNQKQNKSIKNKIKQDIINSRKLLCMKKGQSKSLQQQIHQLELTLRTNSNQTLQSIIDNHQSIQSIKNIYFQYLRQQKCLRQLWNKQLQQNQQLQNKNHIIQRQIQTNKKQMTTDLNNYVIRLTEGRLHLLKGLHYLPQQKKNAAKYLIQQMRSMSQQIKNMINQSQKSHTAIHQLIIDSQRKKTQNQYLSGLLFGADQSAHHFDNMKIMINIIIQKIKAVNDTTRVNQRLKQTQQIQILQQKIYQLTKQIENKKNRWKNNYGISNNRFVSNKKNPIVFFGQLLTQRDIQETNIEQKISKIERQLLKTNEEVADLQKRKNNLGSTLQQFKRQEIAKVRMSLTRS